VKLIVCLMALNVVEEGETDSCNVGVPATEIVAVPVLLAAFPSLPAPDAAVTVAEPAADGVPDTGQEIEAPKATVAGGTGEQVPVVRPAGKPVMLHVALVADAVAEALLVHFTVPV